MSTMIFGLLLWSLVHFIPSIGKLLKTHAITILGENGYKAIFSTLLIISIVLVVLGWKHSSPVQIYSTLEFMKPIALLLMALGFVSFGSSSFPTRLNHFIRHPQLVGVVFWSISHLLLNGDSRSLLLFVWLGFWALLEITLINNREGTWIKKGSTPTWRNDIFGLIIGIAIFFVAAFFHPHISGVTII